MSVSKRLTIALRKMKQCSTLLMLSLMKIISKWSTLVALAQYCVIKFQLLLYYRQDGAHSQLLHMSTTELYVCALFPLSTVTLICTATGECTALWGEPN